MVIDSTFWVAISFIIFLGGLTYLKVPQKVNEILNKLIKDIELPRSWQRDLKQYCDNKGIEFMSTPFDEQAVDELVSLGVKRLKIAGFEATDPRFVEVVASTGLPIIMSAGIGFDFKYWGKFYDIFKIIIIK